MKHEVDIDLNRLLNNKDNIKEVVYALEDCIDHYAVIQSFAEMMSSDYYSKVMWFEIKNDDVLDDYEDDELEKELDEITDILTPLLEYATNLKKRINGGGNNE